MNLAHGAIGALLWLILAGAAAAAPPRARIETGAVVGARSGPAEVFRAIPYAAPPLGPMRWAPPAPALHWRGDRAAIAPGPACAQKIYPGGAPNLGGYNGPISEDCLTLDVTAPTQARHAPVMVWIYGGGNVAGATNLPSYDAVNFARDGVIVVAMNYRLGSLGFFAHPALTKAAPAAQPLYNFGLMDQIAALEWVKRNIMAFGGDPAKVTVFGESAGGADVLALMATPSARGLFQRAIVQSGGGWGAPGRQATFADREAAGAALASKLGLPGAAASADQLRAISAAALIAEGGGDAGVTPDGRLVKETDAQAFARGDATRVPLIIGSNSNEASLMGAFGLTPGAVLAYTPPAMRAAYGPDSATDAALARSLFNDRAMGAPARWIAARQAAHAPAWLYYFSYVPERQRTTRPGTNHASEIPFVFDSIDAIPGRSALATPSERAETALAHSCWVGFAKTGRPLCAGGQPWPAYTAASDQLLEFGDPPRVLTHFRKAQLDAQEAAAGDMLTAK